MIKAVRILPASLLLLVVLSLPMNASASRCKYVTVERVIDGDTFETADGTKVRLLGIDTPETSDPRRNVQWFGREAAQRLKSFINHKRVCLKRDRDRTIDRDRYGRLLRYVWIGDRFVNAELISEGYAFLYVVQPFQFMDEFRELERSARTGRKGLWDDRARKEWLKGIRREADLALTCGNGGTICPEKAREHVGRRVTIRFFVRKSKNTGKVIFLNSRNDYRDPENFTVIIFRKDAFQFQEDPAALYLNRTIDVTGRISLHKGRPEIVATSPDQIKTLSEQAD